MKKAAKAIVSGVLALGIAVGGNVVGAQAAEAVTYGAHYQVHIGNGVCEVRQRVDYNAWEESWFGGSNRDYIRVVYRKYCPNLAGWRPA